MSTCFGSILATHLKSANLDAITLDCSVTALDFYGIWQHATLEFSLSRPATAGAILLTTSKELAEKVALEVERQSQTLVTAPIACEAIRNNSAVILCPSIDAAVEASNRLAPEHLVIYDESLLPRIQHAGSIFVGPSSPEAAGDYASGPNHVLPTSGAARIRGGLSSADFVKVISVQQLTQAALQKLAPAITTLARAEGLEAHARSVEVRLGE